MKTRMLLLLFSGVLHGCLADPSFDDLTRAIDSVTITFPDLPDAAFADGASEIEVSVEVKQAATAVQGPVLLSATRGMFQSAEAGEQFVLLSLDKDGKAFERLTVPADSGIAILTATYGGTVARESIVLRRALPEWAVLDANQFVLASEVGSILELTATLGRSRGNVTERPEVEWSTSRTVGDFAGATWDGANSKSTVKLVRREGVAPGPVTLRVSIPEAGVADSIVVWLAAPK